MTCTPRRQRSLALLIGTLAGLLPLVLGLAVLGGLASFETVRDLAQPWFGDRAWMVPVGVDLGVLCLLAGDLALEYAGTPWPVLRWVALAFTAATVWLNVAAAHGDPVATVMHAAMPSLFIVAVEGIRHFIRCRVGLAAGTRLERIPRLRWLLAPVSSALLWRRMALWHITSYRDALHLDYLRQRDITRLKHRYGRWAWRVKAPLEQRLTLRLLPAADAAATHSADAANSTPPGRPQLALVVPDGAGQIEAYAGSLLAAARQIRDEAVSDGRSLTQTVLARRLRERGHTIANGRLRWLTMELARDATTTA